MLTNDKIVEVPAQLEWTFPLRAKGSVLDLLCRSTLKDALLQFLGRSIDDDDIMRIKTYQPIRSNKLELVYDGKLVGIIECDLFSSYNLLTVTFTPVNY